MNKNNFGYILILSFDKLEIVADIVNNWKTTQIWSRTSIIFSVELKLLINPTGEYECF